VATLNVALDIVSLPIMRRLARRNLQSIVSAALRRVDTTIAWELFNYGLENRAWSFLEAGVQPVGATIEALLSTDAVVDLLEQDFTVGTRRAEQKLRTLRAPTRPWSTREAAIMANRVAEETRGSILAVVRRVFARSGSVSEAQRLVRITAGLDERRAMAVLNLYEKFLSSPGKVLYAGKVRIRVPARATKELAFKRARAYANRLFRQRVRAIVQYERILAERVGQRAEWRLAILEGRIRVDQVTRTWMTAEDERVCPVCEPMNGESARLDQPYSNGLDGPPAHMLCRCDEELA